MPWGFWLGCAFLVLVAFAGLLDGAKEEARETAVLTGLLFHGWAFGLDLVKRNPELKRGSVYVTLGQLEKRGLLVSREETWSRDNFGARRRLYSLTDAGRDEALRRAGAKEAA